MTVKRYLAWSHLHSSTKEPNMDDDYKIIFINFGNEIICGTALQGCFHGLTMEQLYQVFKQRFIAEMQEEEE